ncbi:SDR family NAD(P)-dependent oxidoreductase [Maribellus mangrovi]|uniref:SDR family NAD(P)-dependent oxidoreductase n=1 Tax=Maribellus mangrovi TaxID=3133146 RepID=UPI0030EF7BE8
MNLELSNKNAVVTGGSKGIGRSIALNLANEGCNVALCARGKESLEKTKNELLKTGVKVFTSVCDVGNKNQLDEFLENSKKTLGSIDILVNNVSALRFGDEEQDWEASINLDLLASVRATKKVVPWMIDQGGGNILFISSISGLESGSPPSYAAVKAALISYSKTLSTQLAPNNIRVNTIAPGSIEFEGGLWDQMKQNNREFYDMALASVPSGRLGTPDEIGKVAAFLVSPCASWITGACISVDGGQHRFNL